MGALLRRQLHHLVASLCRVLLRGFFGQIHVLGRNRIPSGSPLVVVANHVNSLVDPMLLLGFLGLHTRVLAKSTLWRHPVVAPLLLAAGALPVYRRGEADPARNRGTFCRCSRALANGSSILLFPEGTSHNESSLRPIRTGGARLALQTLSSHPGIDLRILPVALHYEAKDRFRSRVVVQIGDPIDPRRYLGHPEEVRALTRTIEEGLRDALAPCPTAPQRRVQTRRAWPCELPRLVAAALTWLPYRLPGWVAARFGSTLDNRSSYKLLAALFAFPLYWLGWAALAAAQLGLLAGLLVTAGVAASTPAGLRFFESR